MKLIITIFIILTLGIGFAFFQKRQYDHEYTHIPAPDFVLSTHKGNTISFPEVRKGKPAILFFWATWCPHCRTMINHLDEETKGFEHVEFIIINSGESKAQVNAYLKHLTFNRDVLLDEDSKVSDEYGVTSIPVFYLIDSKGMILDSAHGLPEYWKEVY